MKQIFDFQRPFVEMDVMREIIPGLPDFDLTHLRRLTNTVGVLQHAKYAIPNYHHGYCLDDNSRALILVAEAQDKNGTPGLEPLIVTFLAYMHYMQLPNGKFRNYLSFDQRFLEAKGSEDSMGRAVYALGRFVQLQSHDEWTHIAREMLFNSLPHCFDLHSLRAKAYCLLRLLHYRELHPEDIDVLRTIKHIAIQLYVEYTESTTTNWQWFEHILTYDSAVLPLSLLRAGKSLQDERLLRIGQESAEFLDGMIFEKRFLSTVGNSDWYPKNGIKSQFDQQPIEIPSLILLYKELFLWSGDTAYRKRAIQSFEWFFGRNDLGLPLYDASTKGCSDGLETHGINLNQGGESTISFWQSYLNLHTNHV